MNFTTFDFAAGDAADALVIDFGVVSPLPISQGLVLKIHSWALSVVGPAFLWTLYMAPAALAAAEDCVILDSRTVEATVLDPQATATSVANLIMVCPTIVWPGAPTSVATQLRVTTSGKGANGRLRLAWDWTPAI